MKVRIRKIKLNKGKIRIDYEVRNAQGEYDQFSLSCSEEPLPSFHQALQKLRRYVVEICELPDEDEDRIEIKGVSISFAGPDDTMGCVISAQKELENSNAPLNLNTPHKIEGFYGGAGDPRRLMPGEMLDDLKVLFDECRRYIAGQRKQMTLPFGEG